MKRYFAIGLLCAAGLLLAVQPAAGQDAPPPDTAAVDTTSGEEGVSSQQQVMYRQGGAPASVQRVQQRIARIRGVGAERRVIYPLIIVTPPPAVYLQGGGVQQPPLSSGQAGQTGPLYEPYAPPGVQPSYPYYRDEQGRIRIRAGVGEDTSRVVVVPLRDSVSVDSVQVPSPEEPGAPPPEEAVRPARPPQPPTAQGVARAILETGLFRAIGVNFEFDRSTLLPEAERTLDAVGEALVKYPALRMEVAGHTDAIGPEDYNQRLSEARAQAVKQYLEGRFDLAPEPLTARGYGESQPIATNENVTGRTLNRRVEFRLLNPEAAEQYELPAAAPGGLEENLRRIIREEIRRAQQQP